MSADDDNSGRKGGGPGSLKRKAPRRAGRPWGEQPVASESITGYTGENPEPSDEELLTRFYACEDEAFDKLSKRHRGRLKKACCFLLRRHGRDPNREPVEDILQDLWAKIICGKHAPFRPTKNEQLYSRRESGEFVELQEELIIDFCGHMAQKHPFLHGLASEATRSSSCTQARPKDAEKHGGFDPSRGRFKPYVNRMLHNQIIDLVDPERNHPYGERGIIIYEPPSAPDGEEREGVIDRLREKDLEPSLLTVLKGLIDQMLQCLESLDARKIRLIYSAYCLDKTLEEIGKSMGISIARVWELRKRALKELRDCLTLHGYVYADLDIFDVSCA
jgi:RNA polymerase sigma factor (sigma-70 family)